MSAFNLQQYGITVGDVLAGLSLSRSVFERRFAKIFARTPKAEILRTQLDRVKQLLAETDLPLKQIAYMTGFQYPEYMSAAFKARTGLTLGQYRRSTRRNT